MGVFFNAAEIFDIAIQLEKNGIDFYSHAARNSKNMQVKDLYTVLVGEEKKHQKFFQTTKDSQAVPISPDTLDEEYGFYLKSLVDSIVFTPEKWSQSVSPEKIAGESQVIDLALGMERDSILFYLEMKPLMARNSKKALDTIIREERSHLERLSAMKEKLKQ